MTFTYCGAENFSILGEAPEKPSASEYTTGSPAGVRSGHSASALTNGGAAQTLSRPELGADGMASRMEDMVDDLTSSSARQATPKRLSAGFVAARTSAKSPTTTEFSGMGKETSNSPAFDVRDLVQQMRRPGYADSSPLGPAVSVPTIPSIWNTPFAPRPGETPEPSPRLGSLQHLTPQALGPSNPASSVEFRNQMSRLEEQIDLRSSPQPSIQPTLSSPYGTPTGQPYWARGYNKVQPQASPWQGQSPFASGMPIQQIPVSTRSSNVSRYGAIGESRPRSSRTPNVDQPG
jgi:hypothetical protein